jgi:aromatic ring hydroxylase
MAVHFNDPCQRFAALQTAYYNLISGANESLVRYKGPNGEREVRFSAGNIDALKAEMTAAEAACAVAQGQPNPNRRYAIRGGARRPLLDPQSNWWTPGWWFRP